MRAPWGATDGGGRSGGERGGEREGRRIPSQRSSLIPAVSLLQGPGGPAPRGRDGRGHGGGRDGRREGG